MPQVCQLETPLSEQSRQWKWILYKGTHLHVYSAHITPLYNKEHKIIKNGEKMYITSIETKQATDNHIKFKGKSYHISLLHSYITKLLSTYKQLHNS